MSLRNKVKIMKIAHLSRTVVSSKTLFCDCNATYSFKYTIPTLCWVMIDQ